MNDTKKPFINDVSDGKEVEEDEESESNFFFSFEDTENDDIDEISSFENTNKYEFENSIYARQKPVFDAEDLHLVANRGPQVVFFKEN